MPNPRRTLNASIPWHQLLSHLGLPIQNMALPTRTECPLCKDGIMRVYEDRTCGGQWYYCSGCGKWGDMIQLAAKIWETNISSTVVRLNQRGFDIAADREAIKLYLVQHVNYRRRLTKFWREARARFVKHSATLQRLVNMFRLTASSPVGGWKTGPGRLLGGADTASVERIFAPGVMQHADKKHQRNSPSAHAIFKGAGWDDVLVIPFYDLPWRIRSFLFIGRDGDRENDMVFKLANIAPPGNQHSQSPPDLGLFLHPGVPGITDVWDNTVFAFSDPVLAIRLTMRNFEMSLRPLPIVVWRDTGGSSTLQTCNGQAARTSHAWQLVEGRKIVFWARSATPALIGQAARVGGRISTVGPRSGDSESFKEYCWKYAPRDLLRHIQKNARPWQEVFTGWLEKMADSDVETFFHHLQLAGEDAEQIARRCGERVAERVAKILSVSQGQRSTLLDGCTIVEKEDQWHVSGKRYKRPEVISEAVLRLDKAIFQRRERRVYYKGRILFGGEEISFCAPADDVEKNTFKWMRRFLVNQEKGLMEFNPAWSDRAVNIAKLFQKTKFEQGPDSVGWDHEQHGFVLPNFAIDWGGRVRPMDARVFPESAPARRLEPPNIVMLYRPSLEPYVGALFWATASAVLSNILAPVRLRKPSGIVLAGAGARSVGEAVAEAMGCPVHSIHGAKSARDGLAAEQLNNWPVIFRVEPTTQRRHRKMLTYDSESEQRNCIISLDWHQAMAKALEGRWLVIVGTAPATLVDDGLESDLEVARLLLPAYLQSVCERRTDLGHQTAPLDSLVEEVLRDLGQFLDEHCGGGEDVTSALEVLWPPREHGHPLALADLLGRSIHDNELNIQKEGYNKRKPALIRAPSVDGLFLPLAALAKLFRSHCLPLPETTRISEMLAQSGLLIEDREDGCVFPEKWFRKRVGKLEAPEPALRG